MTQLTFKRSDLERAIKSAQGLGLPVSGFEIAPDGTIRVLTSAATAPQVLSPAEEWKARNGTRAA